MAKKASITKKCPHIGDLMWFSVGCSLYHCLEITVFTVLPLFGSLITHRLIQPESATKSSVRRPAMKKLLAILALFVSGSLISVSVLDIHIWEIGLGSNSQLGSTPVDASVTHTTQPFSEWLGMTVKLISEEILRLDVLSAETTDQVSRRAFLDRRARLVALQVALYEAQSLYPRQAALKPLSRAIEYMRYMQDMTNTIAIIEPHVRHLTIRDNIFTEAISAVNVTTNPADAKMAVEIMVSRRIDTLNQLDNDGIGYEQANAIRNLLREICIHTRDVANQAGATPDTIRDALESARDN
jgi:hypothetical protein